MRVFVAAIDLLRKGYLSNLKLGKANHNYAKHIITHNLPMRANIVEIVFTISSVLLVFQAFFACPSFCNRGSAFS